jgi:hypothetical protein
MTIIPPSLQTGHHSHCPHYATYLIECTCPPNYRFKPDTPPSTKELQTAIPTPRDLALHDLRYLLTYPNLGAWGMETLIETLNKLIPEFLNEPIVHNRGI